MTTKLSGEVALAEYVGKAKAKVYAIFKTLKVLGKFTISLFFKLFDAQVVPSILYASEVWGLVPYDLAESVHTFACKRLLGVRKQTPNHYIYGETGRFPIWIESKIRAVKYWYKIMNMQEDRLPRLAFEREKLENKNHHNWAMKVKQLLEQTGYAYMWELGPVVSEGTFVRVLRQRMRDNFMQSWTEKGNQCTKFNIYTSIKANFGTEIYLESINIAKFRIAYARIRTSTSYLHINRRLIHPDANIKCPFCDEDETEMHFLTVCKIYDGLRIKYLNKHFQNLTRVNLSQILANANEEIIKSVAMFVFYGLKWRSDRIRQIQLQKKITQSINNRA